MRLPWASGTPHKPTCVERRRAAREQRTTPQRPHGTRPADAARAIAFQPTPAPSFIFRTTLKSLPRGDGASHFLTPILVTLTQSRVGDWLQPSAGRIVH